ncbi:tRNA threonylcarbamoyladenosine biosynthesis protein [Mesoplasma entomophilum]|uniref:L-threonylcarbamoyladenylate synthase n=1 Tax=Mesoplasma entomophilum TaxID=2149 RepID=A0A3S5Y0L9_9MOLU|nr:Sua5/YciO/YrdC/YwlC family protein [Mesoplasma entomophilum]ATQ35809.1 translation factor [Mesoplasma entomophilum]ATZ19780.1 tRNA threonylcarbamoyladenosine biosynthesis protein [Mesoplasma entomophilum]
MLSKDQIFRASQQLKKNEVIILPTDTIYGLSAAWNIKNEIKINEIKKANLEKPLIVLISDINQLDILNIQKNEYCELLFEKSTTVIFKTVNGSENIGVRLIVREDIKAILDLIGPIFSTSVNKHGDKPINSKEELENFNKNIKVYFDQEISNTKASRIFNSVTKVWVR